ncbi:MAG TPA: ornithine carbamoyltransferase [Candidatus Krumholzibacteria bacterium]|nr:ornithine carbamoyltransferase [Candidatus Krumholzibacteria bacterium]
MNLRNRHFLKDLDFTKEEIVYLLDLSKQLKAEKKERRETRRLSRRNIALIFEKTSTRTRCAFEVAAFDQGAHVTYLGPSGSQIGHKETMKDTARVLGRMYDAIEYRGYGQDIVEALAAHAGVPVYNGLTDDYHPTQMLADVLTMMEHCDRPVEKISFCYLGDTRNNVSNSLLAGAAILGMDVRLAGPKECWPLESLLETCRKLAHESGARITLTDDARAAVRGADYLYTDVWVSMGEPESKWSERIRLMQPYQVNRALMEATGNARAKFLHCLPAFHNRDTKVGESIFQQYGLDGLEVTEEVFESPASIVFDQAENRLHTIKAILVATLGD